MRRLLNSAFKCLLPFLFFRRLAGNRGGLVARPPRSAKWTLRHIALNRPIRASAFDGQDAVLFTRIARTGCDAILLERAER